MSHYVIIPGDSSSRTAELIKQIPCVDPELVATLVRETVQFECSAGEDELVCQVEQLFPDGAALIRVKSLNIIGEA